jgi:hypothetical protein
MVRAPKYFPARSVFLHARLLFLPGRQQPTRGRKPLLHGGPISDIKSKSYISNLLFSSVCGTVSEQMAWLSLGSAGSCYFSKFWWRWRISARPIGLVTDCTAKIQDIIQSRFK